MGHTKQVLVKDLVVWLTPDLLVGWESSDPTAGDHDIASVAPLETAGPTDLSFVGKGKAARAASDSFAGCLLVPLDFDNPTGRTILRTRDPRATAARAIAKLHPAPKAPVGVHPSAVIGQGVTLGDEVSIGPLVSIGDGASIGAGTSIAAGCVIETGVRIGDHCVIHPRVTIYSQVTIGNHAIVHSGAVLGADGFGFVFSGDHYEKFPQVGRVEIADHVEIGANCCIDRAALGVTSIGEGTKLDNMVHIAHNCQIGKHVVIAAQTGLSGGVIVEDYAVIGGQVGIGDKARIESRAILGSGSGVLTSKIVHAGTVMWGTPARPLKEYLEQLATLSRLAKKRKSK
ncbi:MAG: UDP-3-O-(3-hydroxymyristoyl)glucosamine N-acyltransferase [Acidobacteriota bacterium]